MLRWLLLIVLITLLWRRKTRAQVAPREQWMDPRRDAMPGEEAVREMVADPVCGAFVAKQSALTTVAQGRTWFFCSSSCYRSFLLEHRRAAGQ